MFGSMTVPLDDVDIQLLTALQEDADAIGLSILSGAHMHICPRVLELLKARGLDDVPGA